MAASADKNDKLDYIQDRIDIVVDRVAEVNELVASLHASFESHVEQDRLVPPQLEHISKQLASNTLCLQEHMRRTDLLEDFTKTIEVRFSPIEMDLLRKKAVSNWISMKLKLLAKIGAAVGAISAIGMAAKYVLAVLISQ